MSCSPEGHIVPLERALRKESQMAIEERLASIEAKAGQLSETTQLFNESIERLEDRLATARVAETIWLEDHLGFEEAPILGAERLGPTVTGWSLGFGRASKRWCFLVRPIRRTDDDDRPWEELVFEVTGPRQPLLHASRAVRIDSAPYLEHVLDGIEDAALNSLDRVRVAFEMVKKV
jgi:hypothetical protein